MVSYIDFNNQFFDLSKYGEKLSVCYTKERNADVIHKKIQIYRRGDKLYVRKKEYNETDGKFSVKEKRQRITDKSLQTRHAYLATLFSQLNQPESEKISAWRDFRASKHKARWITRAVLLDTKIVGGVVGKIIAYSANKENPHYKTTASHILGDTLGPLIFPAGLKKPHIEEIKGDVEVSVDSVVWKQLNAQKNYNPIYQSNGQEITFVNKDVTMNLHGQDIQLETVTASNNLVNPGEKDHLHIIYFNGNSGCYQQDYRFVAEDLLEYQNQVNPVPVTAVMFNYPGVLNSGGKVKVAQDLIDAGIQQVQNLLDEGVLPENIVLHGVSLGGSIASHVAARFNKQKVVDENGKALRMTLGGVYAPRTFRSTAQVGRNFFNRALGDNIFSRGISTLCLPAIKLGTWASEWDLDTGKAFFSLPKDRRDYSVVRSSKANRKAYRKANPGTRVKRFKNFVLRIKNNPVDDAILQRGLHISWERRREKVLTKLGWYGREARVNYSNENRSRKMEVFDYRSDTLMPETDGHAKAAYCYERGGEWINPNKKGKTAGLKHRITGGSKADSEAGAVARRAILRMHAAAQPKATQVD